MIPRPPRSTLFPTRRSSDLNFVASCQGCADAVEDRIDHDLSLAFRESGDRKSTRLNSSHRTISYAVFCLKKKIKHSSNIRYFDIVPKCISPLLLLTPSHSSL